MSWLTLSGKAVVYQLTPRCACFSLVEQQQTFSYFIVNMALSLTSEKGVGMRCAQPVTHKLASCGLPLVLYGIWHMALIKNDDWSKP